LPSAPHFSRLFRDAYGCSPREFRRSGADGEVPFGSDALAASRRSHTR
jgi:AraC-like DNA-binding protein